MGKLIHNGITYAQVNHDEPHSGSALQTHSGMIDIRDGTILPSSDHFYTDEFDCPQGSFQMDCGYVSMSYNIGIIMYDNGTPYGYYRFYTRNRLIDFSSGYRAGAKCRLSLLIADINDFYYIDLTTSLYIRYNATRFAGITPATNPIIANWDFSSSYTDTVHEFVCTASGVTVDSAGAHISAGSNYINIPSDLYKPGMIYELEMGEMDGLFGSSSHGIILGFSSDGSNGGILSWHYQTQKFATWDNTVKWQDSTIADKNYFSNSTIKIVYDYNGYLHIYKDDVLVFEPPLAVGSDQRTSSTFRIGKSASTNTTFYNMTVKSLIVRRLSV